MNPKSKAGADLPCIFEKIFFHFFATKRCFVRFLYTKAVKIMDNETRKSKDFIEKTIRKYADTVFRIAFLRTKNKHDAEDIMQEVFLRFVKATPDFSDSEHEKAWFIRTTINRTKSFFGSAWYRKTAPMDENLSTTDTYEAEYDLVSRVKALPKDMGTVIHLFYFEDMSVREIASAMEKTESAVKSMLFRGRKLLKIELESELATTNRKE